MTRKKQPEVIEDPRIKDIAIAVGLVLTNLATMHKSGVILEEYGIHVTGYYNWKNIIRLDIHRIDKQPFFPYNKP
jgi:hypothetical protein